MTGFRVPLCTIVEGELSLVPAAVTAAADTVAEQLAGDPSAEQAQAVLAGLAEQVAPGQPVPVVVQGELVLPGGELAGAVAALTDATTTMQTMISTLREQQLARERATLMQALTSVDT